MFEKLAYANEAAQGAAQQPQGSLLSFFFPFIMMFAIFYFLLIRPQQKQRQQLQKMVDNLKKGDRIITSGGILGTVAGIQNDYIVIKVGDNESMKMEVLKSAVSGLRN